MNKRYRDQIEEFIYRGQPVPFSLGTLCVIMLCLLLFIVSTFTQINIYHQWPVFDESGYLAMRIQEYPYIPQVPVILFIAAVLGAKYGLVTLVIYTLIGFFIWPVFAFGGGIGYVKSFVFGYILGYFPAMVFAGAILHKDSSWKGIGLAAFFGVLIIHISGILYIAFLSLFGLANFTFATSTLLSMGGVKIIYDWIFSFILMLLAYPVKSVLWLAMKNNSPKPKAAQESTQNNTN